LTSQTPFTHSRHYQSLLWVIALSLIALGVYLTRIGFMGQEWLSRSGCAIVILGIWSGMGAIFQERILRGRLRWRRRNAITEARARLDSESPDSIGIDKDIDAINEAFALQTAKLTQSLRLSLGILEFSLLITGTFLWGFGGLFI
jgi:uncharacterized membrane protein YcjF (UPF0283 family)